MFDKPHLGTPGAARGRLVVTDGTAVEPQPMLGDPACGSPRSSPSSPELDLAVNLMTFDPGAALPVHGDPRDGARPARPRGRLVYRLGDAWYPVRAGDAIWMGPFCPQWACAYGTAPSTYLLYKDWNRDPRVVMRHLTPGQGDDASRLAAEIEELARFSGHAPTRRSRGSCSPSRTCAPRVAHRADGRRRLEVRVDAVGNVIGRWEGDRAGPAGGRDRPRTSTPSPTRGASMGSSACSGLEAIRACRRPVTARGARSS